LQADMWVRRSQIDRGDHGYAHHRGGNRRLKIFPEDLWRYYTKYIAQWLKGQVVSGMQFGLAPIEKMHLRNVA